MSALADIEDALISRLEGLTHLGNPAFRVVRGMMISRSDAFPRAMLRETKPAAYVSFRSIFFDDLSLSTIRFFSLYLTAQSLRDQHDARHDTGNVAGMFRLVQLVNDDLDGSTIVTGFTALLSGGTTSSADARVLVVRLTYSVNSPGFNQSLLLDGSAMFDAGTISRLSVGSPRTRTAEFVLPAGNGSIRQALGPKPRSLAVQGFLRGADDAALDGQEAQLESLIGDIGTHTITEPSGRVLNDCVAVGFERRGNRTERWGTLPVSQQFVLRFEQLTY